MRETEQEKLNEQLFDAIRQNNEDKVEELIKTGADINAQNKGSTPLCSAIISRRHINIIKVLLKNGADANALTEGEVPLYHAIANGQINVIKVLLKNGADVNARNIWLPDKSCMNGEIFKASTFIVQHIEKLEIAGLPVSLENSRQKEKFFTSNSFLSNMIRACHEHSEACKAEVEKMQSDDPLLYKFLIETDEAKLVGYLSSPDVREELETGQYKEKYPLYANMIESQYKKGMKARELVVGCEKILQKAVPGQYLSEDIIHKLAEKVIKSEVMSPEVKNFIRREEQKRELVVGCEKILQKGIPDQYLSEDTIHKLAEKIVKSEVMSPEVKNFIRQEGQKID